MASSARVRARLAVTASIFALAAGAGQAFAQEVTQVEDIIVTAQKRSESIQDVPIAVSALSSESLNELKIEGGSELMRAVPNVSFSKANFSMYNFSIRGVGTKAISASSDPAVAVSFNSTPLIRNRLFEQEYLDVQRVEVLRGPQGTLYGRNATGGVVNMIPNLPGRDFEGFVKGEVGNYDSRRMQAVINVPVGETFALRLAGSATQRDGFDYNTFNETKVNNRDLWSTRLSAAWEPTSRFRTNFIWEHFEEDDQRSRTGKQLCTNDPGPTKIGNVNITSQLVRNRLSQGCLPGSLYDDAAYGVPNGGAFAHVFLASLSYGRNAAGQTVNAVPLGTDPYAGLTQSRDLREIATSYDPIFRVKNDVFQFNMEFDLNDNLKLISQTAYAKDDYYSSQDYNRFVSNPIFSNSDGLFNALNQPIINPNTPTPGGYYTDPQLGRSNRMVSADLSRSDNRQWTQELRLQSSYEGRFNFSLGGNYIDFKSNDDYFVFNNLFTFLAEYYYNDLTVPGVTNMGRRTQLCTPQTTKECIYVDPTPLDQLAGDGHNYFRSKNVIHTRSWGVFGEAYYDLSPTWRVTAGLRYTDDRKVSTPYPSQLLLGADRGNPGPSSGGYVSRGYPALPDIDQQWDALTGRLVVDWKPTVSFTDETMVYASFSRGYKGGGANPPRVDINPAVIQYQPLAETFAPEYVNAFEIGAKNTLAGGKLRLNATGFYYDYTDYQVSQIVDRISLNENFDSRTWGLEFEAVFKPTREFRVDANLGYLNTKIGKGEKSIDVMDRTQGNAEWTVLRPWLQVPSNCIAPTRYVERILAAGKPQEQTMLGLQALCGGSLRTGSFNPQFPSQLPLYLPQFFGFTYNPLTEAPNGGRGFEADLSGNELPNAPNWTANIGAQYTFHKDDWALTLRGDYYYQGSSYARVYNTTYDRLKSWDNFNISATLERPADGLVIQAYVKNLFDKTPITDSFTNSDDTGLTANVFTLDPRLVAVSVSKRF
ncbi:TonB-dependent receptor [Caulobacter flavus]|uniref:TonB-dependent receptor n=1 Tax=Caulobacter flavus TaxID=1679497 RepID=A0A2N5CU23_9CAUL|nr:TonB-dependent receptor [Caulobacter flavus]AYV48016.1 TonB-dependent receptor [Caulobacter flavus]PLR16280.1 TonB-dependent receptor [Caulobacter flavus]